MAKPTNIQIRLRVAGIFYDKPFEVSMINKRIDGTMTIENVMEFARLTTNLDYGFEYRAAALNESGKDAIKSMIQMAHRVDAEFKSLGGKKRPVGVYRLIETPIPAGVVAWQYYVIAPDGSSRSTNPVSEFVSPPIPPVGVPPAKSRFTPYDEMTVQGGDTIIWRMVAISTNPAPRLDH
jgi:hypothetical protein